MIIKDKKELTLLYDIMQQYVGEYSDPKPKNITNSINPITHRAYTVEENLKRIKELACLHDKLFSSLGNTNEFEKFRIKLIGHMVDSSIDYYDDNKRNRTLLRKSILNGKGIAPFNQLSPIEDTFILELSKRDYFCIPNCIAEKFPTDKKVENVAYTLNKYRSLYKNDDSKTIKSGISTLDELYQCIKYKYSLSVIYRDFIRFVLDSVHGTFISLPDDLVVDTSKITKLLIDTQMSLIKVGSLLEYDEVKSLMLKTMSEYSLREECGLFINNKAVSVEIDGLKELYG